MRFQPPGPGRSPSAIGRPAELVGPLSRSRSAPRATSANAGAWLESNEKPRCWVYHRTAASTSLTMYRTLTISDAMRPTSARKLFSAQLDNHPRATVLEKIDLSGQWKVMALGVDAGATEPLSPPPELGWAHTR